MGRGTCPAQEMNVAAKVRGADPKRVTCECGGDPAQDAWDFGGSLVLVIGRGGIQQAMCSLELLIYSVGDLTISILGSWRGGGKAPLASVLFHQLSCIGLAVPVMLFKASP